MKKIILTVAMVVTVGGAFAQGLTPRTKATNPSSEPAEKTEMKAAPALNWEQAPVDIVLQAYGEQIGKTILKDPGTPNATISLKSREGQSLSTDEYLEAIEVVLEMNGVHLEPYGEKFIRAIPRAKARKVVGMAVYMNIEDVPKATKAGTVISVRLTFKYIGTEEAQKALEGFKSDSGLLQVFERTNSILVTDTWENIKRMDEVIRSIDIATPVTENVFVRQIKNASAQDIKTALEAIVQESQKELEKDKSANSKNAQQSNNRLMTPVGSPASRLLNRTQPQAAAPADVNNESLVMSVSDADRGMIRGKVLILADERSNKLVIVTQKPNMDFFDKVIEQLDIETTPDTVVKVYRLKYAEAEEVADMINDLIGNASSSKSSSKGNQNANAKKGQNANVSRSNNSSAQKKSVNQRSGEAKAGELSKDNTTVLADKRINGLVVMTEKDLVKTLESIIESMDVKLSQVLIETVIIEVGLGDTMKTGIDWVHGLDKDGNRYNQALGGGGGDKAPIGGSSSNRLFDAVASALPSIFTPGASGLSYAIFSEKLNLSAVIALSKTDSSSKYLASPIIMTVDNKEAQIEATEVKYMFKGYQYSGSSMYGTAVPDYEQKDVGIKIKVTPKINPNGTVMLSVEEEYSQEGTGQDITGQNDKKFRAATTVKRTMSSDVSLENGQTVVFGGLTETQVIKTETGIPILKDIPYVGRYLFGKTEDTEARKELLVFMTPYVLRDGDEAEAEALRRKMSLSDQRPWEDHGWSKSKLADPVSAKEQLRKQKAEWKKLDEEHAAEREIEKAKEERVELLIERMQEEAEKDAKAAKEKQE